MVGNDIVDLSISQVGDGTRKIRYLDKLFSDKELDIIHRLGDEDIWIWLLWSVKESVYKIVSRIENRIRYAPKTLRCISITKKSEGKYETIVAYQGHKFVANSELTDHYIHTVASNSMIEINQLSSKVFTIFSNENESTSVDRNVIDYIKDKLGSRSTNITLKRDENRVPHVFSGNQEVCQLSISHHGGYGAFGLIYL
ncbi:MAG: phosphopantetheinyl transferase (holo-ACP synthase) [Saprospiraceae bacterium]|jgi:phosphopantetheinyl transferase (holo-ACP synthase)|tara:strand:- start:48 stop:641 length:594 start_codon:yes stop_codon:yes gene_type:complete